MFIPALTHVPPPSSPSPCCSRLLRYNERVQQEMVKTEEEMIVANVGKVKGNGLKRLTEDCRELCYRGCLKIGGGQISRETER